MTNMLKRMSVLLLLIISLAACESFDSSWNPLPATTNIRTHSGYFEQDVTMDVPAGWRVYNPMYTQNRRVMTVSGSNLNEVVLKTVGFDKSCYVDSKDAVTVELIEVEKNYKKCMASGEYKSFTFFETNAMPTTKNGFEGIHFVSKVKAQHTLAVPSILESYVLIVPEHKTLIIIEYFAVEEIQYQRYKSDFEFMLNSIKLR